MHQYSVSTYKRSFEISRCEKVQNVIYQILFLMFP
jgi:hypothetical protein